MARATKRRRLSRDQRQALVLQGALAAFADDGYHRASMEEIALRAGISKPVLYDHFDSKRELYIAVIEEQVQTLAARILPHADPASGTLEERVRLAALRALQFARENPRAWRLLFQEPTGDQKITNAFVQMREATARAIAANIADHEVEVPGGIDRELATGTIALLLMATIEQLGDIALGRPSADLETLLDIYMGLVWVGIRQLSGSE